MNLLACDIGNSFIKLRTYSTDDATSKLIKVPSDSFSADSISGLKFDSAAISSVVPKSTELLTDILKKNFSITPMLITNSSKFNLTVDYKTPATLGIDRICAVEGAFRLFSDNVKNYSADDIIAAIDFGTATTINTVMFEKRFTGGIIAPGMYLMADSLNKKTAQLPMIELENYNSIIGDSTVSAITSGIINATLGLIEKTIIELKKINSRYKFHIYITGGKADFISKHLSIEHELIPDLVLLGVKTIYQKNITHE